MIIEDGKLKTDEQTESEYENETIRTHNEEKNGGGFDIIIDELWEFDESDLEEFFNDIMGRLICHTRKN